MVTVKYERPWIKESARSFIWLHAKRIVAQCEKPVFLDFGEYLFWVKKFDGKYGIGEVKSHLDFKKWIDCTFSANSHNVKAKTV